MNKNFAIALTTTALSFVTLYAPQPILPLLSDEFAVTPTAGALLVTVTLAPLGIAPIVYGYFLQAIPARTMLRVAVFLLIVNQLLFFLAAEFWHLVALRFAQGLLMPAIFTSLMTYCATMAPEGGVRRAMGWYISATILGGFLSRALSGVIADFFGWHFVFVAMALMLTPAWWSLRFIDADAKINFARLDVRSIRRVLADPLFRNSYLVLFGVFFVFAGVLNLLPYHITEVHPAVGPLGISLLYTGYLIGIPLALVSEKFIRAFGVARALIAGLAVNAVGLAAFVLTDTAALAAAMVVFAAGMFFIHAALSGLANALATEHKGVVNGLYVSVYYISGALGSYLPAHLHLAHGWHTVLLASAAILAAAALAAGRVRA